MDLFVVPTLGFNLLYVLVIVRLARRELVWINVTAHPSAEWIARQITEAFPWNEVPRYLIRDQDKIYGVAVTRRLRAMGIRDKPIAAGSPWQNSFAERLIGTIRRECVDHIVVLGETHLRRIVREYARYYTILRERPGHWTRMRRSLARFSKSDASCRTPWLAGCITNTSGFRFSARTAVRLIMRSNLVGCSTGMSAGFAPRRILSTKSAARRPTNLFDASWENV